MNIVTLRTFLMWCTILNVGLMALAFLVLALARDWVYRMHSRWFPMPREAFNVVIYSFLGVMKLFVWVFNIIPLLALVIMT